MKTCWIGRHFRWAAFLLSIVLQMASGLCCSLLGQVCERRVVISYADMLNVEDLEATLGKQPVLITDVKPVRTKRILVLVKASDARTFPKDFRKLIEQVGRFTHGFPAGSQVAFGVFLHDMEFSSFTSDRHEQRSNLDRLAARAQSGALGKGSIVEDVYMALWQGLDYLEYPVQVQRFAATPSLRQRPPDLPLNSAGPGDILVVITRSVWRSPAAETCARRFGFPKGAVFIYSDLLLCGTGPKGEPLIAARP